MLELKYIRASYHKDYPILNDVNMCIEDGEKVVLLGRNGAGKTTFAQSIFGLTPIISGEVIYNGIDLLGLPLERLYTAGLGYFMQEGPVFPQMTVRENLWVSAGRISKREFLKRFEGLKKQIPLFLNANIESVPAGSLSGGERSQLCLAMSIFNNPGLLILDEPFAGLSPSNSNIILRILNDYQSSSNASVLLIAQDRKMAKDFSNTHYIIREGKVINDDKV